MHDKLGLVGANLGALVARIPLGRRGRPEDIAQAMLFLASSQAAFTVGGELTIDGG